MAGISSVNPAQDLAKKFSFKNMQVMMDYANSRTCESTTLAVDAQEENIQNTGNLCAILNGQPIYLEDDAVMDISADTTETVAGNTAWATGQSYTAGNILFHVGTAGTRYRCIESHTSRDDSDVACICNEPGNSDIWTRYWVPQRHDAVQANGTVISTLYERWFLVTAIADGTLQVWESGDESAYGTAEAECKVPLFDPKTYIPLGFLHTKNTTASDIVVGVGDWNESSVTTTFLNVTGPVFPHEDNWDMN